jgi:FecR protein
MSSQRNSSFGRRFFVKVTTALGAVAFLAPVVVLGRPAAAAGSGVGEVTKLRGQARASRNGSNVMLDVGTHIQAGDTIVTGPDARLKLQFLDGSTMTLGETSKLNIDTAAFDGGKRDIAATLLDGIVRCAVAKAAEGSNFEVSSSLVTSAARGTEWIVAIKDHTTSLLVLEGVVNAKGLGETLTDLPDAPISKGIDLSVKQGLAVGEPARSIGLDSKDIGHPMNWKAERIDKLVSATDF